MRIYHKKEKSTKGWGYWGDFGEIDMGFSVGYIGEDDVFQADKLHYHQKGTVYILVLEGSGNIEVDEKTITIEKDVLIKIDPGEKYRHIDVITKPFYWITICTSKDSDDKVVINI